jgi:hypothetical protein
MIEETDRRRPITAAQWAHARAVSEGAPPTRDRIAGILDCNVTAIYEHARAEGWKRLDFRRAEARAAHADFIELAGRPAEEGEGPEAEAEAAPDPAGAAPPETAEAESGARADPVELLRRGTALLARRLSSLLERAEKGGRLNRAEFDGLAAMARVIERWEALAQESVRQEEKKSDEELAEIYRRVERRIVELAREEAERLVAAGYRPGMDFGNGEELADPGAAGPADDLAGVRGAG